LAHQQLYLPGDTGFNESFARAVEVEGVRRWLNQREQLQLLPQYLLEQQMHQDFVAMLLAGREQLQGLYVQPLRSDEMRQRKQLILTRIQQQDYPAFKLRWDNVQKYDAWMAADFNNAKLATIANYHQWLPAFQQLLADNDGDFSRFYQAATVLSQLDTDQRNQQLQALAALASAKLGDTTIP
jgi:predicted aminopeptidase